MDDADDLVSYEDAAAIGFKVVEMADRVKVGDKCIPGARAKWGFEIDGVKFDVAVTVRREG